MNEEKKLFFYKAGFVVFLLTTFVVAVWGLSLSNNPVNCLQKECKPEISNNQEIKSCVTEQVNKQGEQLDGQKVQEIDFSKVTSLGNDNGYDVFEFNGIEYYCYGCNFELKGGFCQVCDYCKNCGDDNA